jgi:fructokinase
MNNLLWGLDIGGTKVECAVASSDSVTSPIVRRRALIGASQGYQHVLSVVADLVNTVAKDLGSSPSRIGVSCCGAVNPSTGLIKNSNATCLNGKPFPSDLAARVNAETRFLNDANALAFAEALLGSARGAEVVFGVILGSGVGGGVIVGGKVIHGRHGIGGEWGHNVYDPSGPACYCGKSGCLEHFISGPALERFYRERAGRTLPLSEIDILAQEGEPHAQATIHRLVSIFGESIARVINILDPDVVVIGGGVSNIRALYQDVAGEVSRHIFNDVVETRIIQNQLGDSAGVFGALMMSQEG